MGNQNRCSDVFSRSVIHGHPGISGCQVPMAWLTLGGSEEADSYLKTRMQAGAEVGVSLLQSCSEAERICAKHLVDLEESEAGTRTYKRC